MMTYVLLRSFTWVVCALIVPECVVSNTLCSSYTAAQMLVAGGVDVRRLSGIIDKLE